MEDRKFGLGGPTHDEITDAEAEELIAQQWWATKRRENPEAARLLSEFLSAGDMEAQWRYLADKLPAGGSPEPEPAKEPNPLLDRQVRANYLKSLRRWPTGRN